MNYEINGASIAVFEQGTDTLGTIITVHGGRGFSDHRSDFRAYGPLSDQFRVISFDMRGHGASSQTGPFTYEQLADDIESLRLLLVGKPVVLIGGSFGGMIALTYALKYPAGMSHLILRGTVPSWHHEIDAIENVRKAAERFPSLSPQAVERLFAGDIANENEARLISFSLAPLADGRRYDADASIRASAQTVIRLETLRALFKVGHAYDVRDQLTTINTPTLVICGSQDWTCTPEHSVLMANSIPAAELLMVDGAPHGVHHDSGPQVRETIRDFIRRRR